MALLELQGQWHIIPPVDQARLPSHERSLGRAQESDSTVWLPYTLQKMNHAFHRGRKAKVDPEASPRPGPVEIFRQHFVVAPYPEENVQPIVAEVAIERIVFGSRFPPRRRPAYPYPHGAAQLSSFSEEDQRRIMGDNLQAFLAPSTP